MARSNWILLVALLLAFTAACDKLNSPTAPTNSLSGVSAAARAESDGCPPSYQPIDVNSVFYDPAIDANGDGIICLKVNLKSHRVPPPSHLIDNNPRRRAPSTAGVQVILEHDDL